MARPKKLTEQDIERGAKLLRLREQRGLTQSELAAKAILHPTEISRLETGAAKFQSNRIQLALARGLGCRVGELVEYVLGDAPAPSLLQGTDWDDLQEDIDDGLVKPPKGPYAARVDEVWATPTRQALDCATQAPNEALLGVLETASELGLKFDPEVVAAAQLLAGESAPKVTAIEWAAALSELAARRTVLTATWRASGAAPPRGLRKNPVRAKT